MALKANLCSVMHAEMRPRNCLGFHHSGSRGMLISNLSFGKINNAPTTLQCRLSLRNDDHEIQQYNYSKYNNKKVNLCMSAAQRATKRISAAVKPLEVDGGATTLKVKKKQQQQQAAIYTTKVVSVETLVGPKGAVGEICQIDLDHGDCFHFVEGQYLGVILHPDDDDSSFTRTRVISSYFSIASCRDGDSFDGKTLSLCVRRAELSPDSISNFLCNTKKGDQVDIIGPFGKTMVFPEDPKAKNIMVATSTGIAPFRSNLQRIFVEPNSGVSFTGLAWLINGADNYNSLLYNAEFATILDSNPDHFRYQTALGDPNNSVADSIYENGDEIFTLLNGGAYIYFSGSKTMMPTILDAFEKITKERGVVWKDFLALLKKNNQWRVEVY